MFFKNDRHSLFKNMAILATGTGIAKVIGLISIPILTRVYTPEHFGLLSLFLATTMILMPFTSMTYSMAIPLPKRDEFAINLAFVSMLILIFVTTTISLLFYFFSASIFELFDLNNMTMYWWLVPVFLFLLGTYDINRNFAIRKKNFKLIFKSQVWQSLTDSITKIGLGLVGIQPLGLLVGVVIAQLVGSIVLSFRSLKHLKKNFLKITKKRSTFLLNYYIEYPKYRLVSQFLLIFSKQSILIFSAIYFGKTITGQLGLAFLAIGLPLQLFGETTGKAYYAEIAKIGKHKPEEIYELTKKVIKKLFLFSLIPFVLLAISSPSVFTIAFGEEWYDAGVFTSLLTVYMLAAFIAAPISNVLNVFNKQKLYLRLNIIRVTLIIFLFSIIWILELEAFESVLFFSILMAIYFTWMMWYILSVIKTNITRMEK